MKKQITITAMGILMLIVVTATIYSGEPETFTLPGTFEYYSIVGNSTPINLNMTQDGLNVTIVLDKYQASDTFEIIFFNRENEVVRTVYRGGGGSSVKTRYVDRNVTVYVPEYINTTETIEVEKIVDNTITIETEYELWKILLSIVGGIGIGCFVVIKLRNAKKRREESRDERVQ